MIWNYFTYEKPHLIATFVFPNADYLVLKEVYSKNQSTYSILIFRPFLFTFCRSLQGPPRPPRTQSQIDMVSQSNELSSITTAKKLPRSSSEPKVDKHLKRESRALKSRSVHFDGTGMSNTICDVGFLSKRGLFLTKILRFFLQKLEHHWDLYQSLAPTQIQTELMKKMRQHQWSMGTIRTEY